MKHRYLEKKLNKNLFKLTFLIKKNNTIPQCVFEKHWIEYRRLDVFSKGKVRHVYNSIISDEKIKIKTDAIIEFSGIEEIWFNDRASANYYLKHIDSIILKEKEILGLLNISDSVGMVGKCHSVIETPCCNPNAVVKIIIMNVRRQGMNINHYRDYWINFHGNLVFRAPESQERHHRIEYCPIDHFFAYKQSKLSFDGIATIQFQSAEAQR